MIKSRGLNHINLNVSDIRRSLRFYQEAFGLEIKFWEGQRMVFLGSPGVHDIISSAKSTRASRLEAAVCRISASHSPTRAGWMMA